VNKTQADTFQFTADLTKLTTDESPSNELLGVTKHADETLKSSSETVKFENSQNFYAIFI
jgi:hypothetical protein